VGALDLRPGRGGRLLGLPTAYGDAREQKQTDQAEGAGDGTHSTTTAFGGKRVRRSQRLGGRSDAGTAGGTPFGQIGGAETGRRQRTFGAYPSSISSLLAPCPLAILSAFI
jgi:hypothetical protein